MRTVRVTRAQIRVIVGRLETSLSHLRPVLRLGSARRRPQGHHLRRGARSDAHPWPGVLPGAMEHPPHAPPLQSRGGVAHAPRHTPTEARRVVAPDHPEGPPIHPTHGQWPWDTRGRGGSAGGAPGRPRSAPGRRRGKNQSKGRFLHRIHHGQPASSQQPEQPTYLPRCGVIIPDRDSTGTDAGNT